MKRFTFLILVIMAMPFIGASPVCSEEQEKPKEWALAADPFLWPMCNDSIQKMVEGKAFLVLHANKLWSIIVNDENYSIIYGDDEYDEWTMASLGRPIPIVEWGMDSLAVQAKRMTPNYRQEYFPSDERLSYYSDSGEMLFEEMNVMSYSGPDSKSFNAGRRELSTLMITYPLALSNMLMHSDVLPKYNSGYPKRLYVPAEGERRIIHGKGAFQSIKIYDADTNGYALGHEENGHITATYNWLTVESTVGKNSVAVKVSPNNTDEKRHLTIEGNLGNAKVMVTVYQATN